MTPAPDVSVIVAVYNTMPYLTECLDSLVGQSIGLDRLEIVAVDDGSTDDSGKELDRYAERYPDTVRALHQANSGGPAAPSNRGLELARGRYVYFVGSDDRLGLEALERLVTAADEYGSDVVVGKMVGTGGRYVHQALYKSTEKDVGLHDSALPWTLANTKLFRRELVERHGLRFPEDMPVGSDQPFTIEACVRARRISVLADYTYYYAVRREDAGNITYRANHLSRLECTGKIMRHTAGLIEAGPERDAVLRRHFTWELAKLFRPDFLELDRDTQEKLCRGVARLCDDYLTDAIRTKMGVKERLLISLAQRGETDALREAVRHEAEHGAPPFLLEDGRAYACYPGFRDAELAAPDDWFEILEEAVSGRLGKGVEGLGAEWLPDGRLSVTARIGVTGDTGSVSVRLADRAMPKSADKPGARRLPDGHELPRHTGETTTEPDPGGAGTVVRARVPVPAGTGRWGVRLYLDVAGSTYEIPVPAAEGTLLHTSRWVRSRLHRHTATANNKGRLVVTATAVPPRHALASGLRRLVPGLGRK
ncbi:glycosyltransferase [Streptomyces sp. TRM 70361]|uniref:glycosyltransferase family 2 protein n=1 Tax=Streptomyces sp. TRM 70361 TaxID=3116553 RepID=UPI002E7AE497|nr:glycosyltransferase [Streptomyces sp. TRM 70361]MEE1938135.1 glycosyltransferase [Streptomyces sp. TRM 70361]